MILKALYDYYHRCGELPPLGYTVKKIRYIIVIDNDGTFLRVEDRGHDASFMVIKGANNVTSGAYANVLWGKSKYIVNLDPKAKKISKEYNKWFDCNYAQISSLAESYSDNKEFKAVKSFYEKQEFRKLENDELWNEISQNDNSLMSFQIQGNFSIVAEQSPDLDDYCKRFFLNDIDVSKDVEEVCLITGNKSNPVLSVTMTPILNAGNGKLVSFQKDMGFDSYGKQQGLNATISKEAEFYCFTALQHLLRNDSRNKFLLRDRTFVFWSSSNNDWAEKIESLFLRIIGLGNKDNPDRHVDIIYKSFQSIFSGKKIPNSNDKFYVLGLAPFNKARIGVIYWREIDVKGFAENIQKHFNDMEICNNNQYIGLYDIIDAVSVKSNKDKKGKIPPNIPEAVMKSIIEGTPYPYNLFSACLRRIKAETDKDIYITRAAILKGYLNRNNNINDKKIKNMLDKTNDNIGYLCGRLFATLVKIQEEANGISSIRERYMNSASTTPAVVFANLLNLSIHHEEKLYPGRKIQFEQLKSEILDKVTAVGFPAHLDINDQARFFVGYYHQRQDFFTKKAEKENNETIINN